MEQKYDSTKHIEPEIELDCDLDGESMEDFKTIVEDVVDEYGGISQIMRN